MRICLISDSYPTLPIFGGISVYTRTAAHALAALGHDVHVLIGRLKEINDFTDGDVKVHIRPISWLPLICQWLPGLGESWGLARALRKLHRQYSFDIVEFPNWEGCGLVSTLWKIVPTVVRLHTSTADVMTVLQRAPTIAERFTIWAEKASARLASATVTHSNYHRDNMRALYRLKEIHVIPHGIVLPTAPLVSNSQTQAVLAVGPLNARKGIDTLLAAIPLVLTQVPLAEFWLVGSDRNQRHEKLFWKTNPEISKKRVRFFGVVSGDLLANFYATCSVYASAAVYESFGLTFVEAMAYGKPVVGCRESAVQEIVEDGRTGFLVAPNDAKSFAATIIKLLVDKDLSSRLGSNGQEIAVQRYSADRMAKKIEAFYAGLLVGV